MAEAQTERLNAAQIGFLLAAVLLGFWSRLGAIPLFDLDEGAFSEATLEMLGSGNWLTTTLNGEPRYDKPILIYWLQAAAVKLLGRNEFAFRLPSALCATLWLFVVYRYALLLFRDRVAATVAAGSLALGLMSSIIGHAAIADALLNLWIALAMLEVYRQWQAPTRGRLLRIHLWMALGFLTKGPIAVALPLLVSLLFFAWQRALGAWLRAVFNPLGWLLFAAVVSVWLVPLWNYDHGDFLRHFLLDHNLKRYDSTLQGHGGKPWYYLAMLPLIVAPFTALLPAVFARARHADPLDRYLLLWFGTVFVFFSFSGTQLPHYLLYGCTPLFLLFGRVWRDTPARGLALLPALLLSAALAAVPFVLSLIPANPERPYETGIVALAAGSVGWSYHAISLLVGLGLLYVLFVPGLESWRALLGAGLLLSAQVWYAVLPVLGAAQQQPVMDAALRARALNLPVRSYRTFLPSFSVYRGSPTPNGLPAAGELVFLRLDRIPDLQRELGASATLIPEFKRGGVALLRLQGSGTPDEGGATP